MAAIGDVQVRHAQGLGHEKAAAPIMGHDLPPVEAAASTAAANSACTQLLHHSGCESCRSPRCLDTELPKRCLPGAW
jgi:hypothetical protein